MSGVLVLDAPSSLGLRPASESVVPGCYQAPQVLRAAGLLAGLDVEDRGQVTPPAYDFSWDPSDGVRNSRSLQTYSVSLADRVESLLDAGFVAVLGGDCSILVGEALALRRRGRFGLAFIDGHGDFRHPGNGRIVAAAGEDLALVTGRGDARLMDLEGRGPSIREEDVLAVGMRPDDVYIDEMVREGIEVWTSARVRDAGNEAVLEAASARLDRPELHGFWIHLDVDVLDAAIMPAVDSPEPDGLDGDRLAGLLAWLVAHPQAAGMDVCIFDPDLDPDGTYAARLVEILRPALLAVASRP